MKIIFDNIIFALQQSGGISIAWKELLSRALSDPDIESHFITYPNVNAVGKALSFPSTSILSHRKLQIPISIERYLSPHIQEKGIFHSSYYRTVSNANVINITTVHDCTYEYFRNGLPLWVHHHQKQKALVHSKKIICVSEHTKKDVLRFFPSLKDEQIVVIYNGVDSCYHEIPQKEEKQLIHLVPFSSGSYTLYVGDRKSNHKNFKIAVKACAIAKLPLVIVGGGILTRQEVLLLTETIGLHQVKILQGINNTDLNVLYNHALCLLYPSSYEGFGIPVIEAQKAGCLVVSSTAAAIPEVAGKGAILMDRISEFHFGDVLKEIQKDITLVEKVKKEGLINAHRFSWDQCYLQTKQLYQETYEMFC